MSKTQKRISDYQKSAYGSPIPTQPPPKNLFKVEWKHNLGDHIISWLNEMTPGWQYEPIWSQRCIETDIGEVQYLNYPYDIREDIMFFSPMFPRGREVFRKIHAECISFRTGQHAILFKLTWVGETEMENT